jgi:8-oxo-dGTP pyrophosphatase MutT (NUDIX family)
LIIIIMSDQPSSAPPKAGPVNEKELKRIAALLAGGHIHVATHEDEPTTSRRATATSPFAIETSPTSSVKTLRARWEENSNPGTPTAARRPSMSLEEFHLLQRSRVVAEQLQREQAMNLMRSSGGGSVRSLTGTPPQPADRKSVSNTSASPAASSNVVLVNYQEKDYRGFIFVVHPDWGLLLLHCTRKASKPPHYQLPGGHVDDDEFEAAGTYLVWFLLYHVPIYSLLSHDITFFCYTNTCSSLFPFMSLCFIARESHNAKSQLLQAAKVAAARELWEETGLDVREQLDRLEPASLRTTTEAVATLKKKKDLLLPNEYKHRLFFFLQVNDNDFYSAKPEVSEQKKFSDALFLWNAIYADHVWVFRL